MLNRLGGWILAFLNRSDRELDVEPHLHPYYQGETSVGETVEVIGDTYTGSGLKHEEWCEIHWDCCGYCKCGAQDHQDFRDAIPSSVFLNSNRTEKTVRDLEKPKGLPWPCRLFGHAFGGWRAAGELPGDPLPTAYCSRCEREL